MDLLVCSYCGAVSTKSGLIVKLGTASAESLESLPSNGSRDGRYHCPGCNRALADAQQEILLENLAHVIPSLSAADRLAVAKVLHHYAVTWGSDADPLEEKITAVAPEAGVIGRLAPRDRAEFLQYVAILLSVLALADDVIANYLVPSTVSLPKAYVSQAGDQSEDQPEDQSQNQNHNIVRNRPRQRRGIGYGKISYTILPGHTVRFQGEWTLIERTLWCLVTPYVNNFTYPDIVATSSGSWTYNVDVRRNLWVWFFLSRDSSAQTVRRLSAKALKTQYFPANMFTKYRIVYLSKDRLRVKLEVPWNESISSLG